MEETIMTLLNPIRTTVAEQRERENLKADIAKNEAYNTYIAMMTNVELPEANNEEVEELHHEE